MKFTLETTLQEYIKYHQKRTVKARIVCAINPAEFALIWTKNYYEERCGLLEEKIKELENK